MYLWRDFAPWNYSEFESDVHPLLPTFVLENASVDVRALTAHVAEIREFSQEATTAAATEKST